LNRKRLHWDEFSVARVIAEHRGSYKVRNATGTYAAKITGKQMFNASSREDYPAVGDWVAITELQKKEKDRAFGKLIKKAKKELREYGHKDY